MKEKLFYPLLGVIVLLGLLVVSQAFETNNVTINKSTETAAENKQDEDSTSIQKNNESTVLVTRVIDGDTIELESGTKVRYIGIDTPETVDPSQAVGCFGKEASAKNAELVAGKKVRLEKDVSNEDRYGRLLRYVYVGTVFVNEYLVKEGFAKASSYPPDVKYQSQFQESQSFAQKNNKGLWGSCNLGTGQVQSSNNYTLTPLNSSDCQIKGNISSSGEKIYHLPGQRYYNQTVIDESKGERWFCSEDAAKAAGWRASKV